MQSVTSVSIKVRETVLRILQSIGWSRFCLAPVQVQPNGCVEEGVAEGDTRGQIVQ